MDWYSQAISERIDFAKRTLELAELSRPRENLNSEESNALEKIYTENNDIFLLPSDKLTYTNARQFQLPLIERAGILNRKQYRLPVKYKAEVSKQVQKLLD